MLLCFNIKEKVTHNISLYIPVIGFGQTLPNFIIYYVKELNICTQPLIKLGMRTFETKNSTWKSDLLP